MDHPHEPPKPDPPLPSTRRVVMDIVAGWNLRRADNLLQAITILTLITVGSLIGAAVGGEIRLLEPYTVAVPMWGVGAFAGLVGGFLISGAVLMVYRLFRH